MEKPVSARVGRFGPFVQIGTKRWWKKPKFVAIPEHLNMDTITLDEALFYLLFQELLVLIRMEMKLKQILEDLDRIYKLNQNIIL